MLLKTAVARLRGFVRHYPQKDPVRACVIFCLAVACRAQSAPARFEVASIRVSDEDSAAPSGMLTSPGLMKASNVTLKRCITGAYVVGADRVLGGPDWIDSDRFQITARADGPVGDRVLNEMLQTLLAERFNLKLHHEKRTREVLILAVAKNGPKLQRAADAATTYNNGHSQLDAKALTMDHFAEILSRNLGLPVVDRTGLTGAFNLTLQWNPDSPGISDHEEVAAALRLEMSRAVLQQLGLSLKSQRMAVDVLVIDEAKKPTEN